MRRKKLSQMVYDNYPTCSLEDKQTTQELVFVYYYDRNDQDLELALEEIAMDLDHLEKTEQYERCQILKDILEKFE